MWAAFQRSMSSLQMSAHQLRNQSAKLQQLPEEQARAHSTNTNDSTYSPNKVFLYQIVGTPIQSCGHKYWKRR